MNLELSPHEERLLPPVLTELVTESVNSISAEESP